MAVVSLAVTHVGIDQVINRTDRRQRTLGEHHAPVAHNGHQPHRLSAIQLDKPSSLAGAGGGRRRASI